MTRPSSTAFRGRWTKPLAEHAVDAISYVDPELGKGRRVLRKFASSPPLDEPRPTPISPEIEATPCSTPAALLCPMMSDQSGMISPTAKWFSVMTGFQSISGGRRRSKYGIVENIAYISIADFRPALSHEEGRDRLRILIQVGPAAGLIVCIQWSQLRYGYRPWFLCPECDKRAGRLYIGAKAWKCRTCSGLRYRSQRDLPHAGPLRAHHQHLNRALAIRDRLGQPNGWLGSEIPPSPAGMHGRTYMLLILELIEHDREAVRFLRSRYQFVALSPPEPDDDHDREGHRHLADAVSQPA